MSVPEGLESSARATGGPQRRMTESSLSNGSNGNGEISRSPLRLLALTALGVVYGDIGTSPLYAVRECFFGPHRVGVSHENVLGVLSLIVWSLIIVVTLKYHVYVLRADNRGEGGILALMALVRGHGRGRAVRWVLVSLGLFGAALLYGDGIITPAISVLGALEGLEVATSSLTAWVVPGTVIILIGLFSFQRRGTTGVGKVFGPIMLVWFATLAFLGVASIIQTPQVLAAVNPVHAFHFFVTNGLRGYLVLGAVFLVATGGEALYADLGHFGEKPIQIDWFGIVAPSLLLNYFGQGALVLRNPAAAMNPFYHLAPRWALYPLVLLATMAAIIASQAVISGVFSLTSQAVQLGYAPRVKIVHTSAREMGQIYLPGANWLLMIATILLVVGFRSSSNLAAAYGIAVTTTMIVTTLLAFVVARRIWHWPLLFAIATTALFLLVDLAFFGANIVKVAQGGWLPLLIGLAVWALMSIWHRERNALSKTTRDRLVPMESFIQSVGEHSPLARVDGTAVYLTRDPEGVPIAMLHNVKLNRVLHRRNLLVTVVTEEIPHVRASGRVELEDLGSEFYRLILHYGFMETPNIPADLQRLRTRGLEIDPSMATYILSSETLVPIRTGVIGRMSASVFAFMSRNAVRPPQYFQLPANRVAELGMMIEL